MEKLISMVDFVKGQNNKNEGLFKDDEAFNVLFNIYKVIHNYAKFLSEPLQLWMFVPCLDNIPLSEDGTDREGYVLDDIMFKQYQQAKERCYFEGFEICNRLESVKCVVNGNFHFSYENSIKNKETIEDLVKYNLTLTQTAKNKYEDFYTTKQLLKIYNENNEKQTLNK